jgi:hypothetical protein
MVVGESAQRRLMAHRVDDRQFTIYGSRSGASATNQSADTAAVTGQGRGEALRRGEQDIEHR